MKWVFLSVAIIAETIATSALKYSNGFKNIIPSVAVIICYLTAFYFFSLTLKQIPVGVAYAIWSGVGIILIALVSRLWHKQVLDLPAIIGIGFIIIGVVIMNVFSKSVTH
jgi:small multidrug resistance pump